MADETEPWEALAEYVNATPGMAGQPTEDFIKSCWEEAAALVTMACGTSLEKVPAEIVRRATLECGSELFHRRKAPSGLLSQFAGLDGGNAARMSRDPMAAASTILAPYLPLGFG